MQTFEITLKNEKEKSYRLIILLIVVLQTLFFTYLLFDKTLWKNGVAGLVIIAVYIIYKLIVSKANNQRFQFGPAIFFLLGIANFSFTGLWIINLLFAILSTIALQKTAFYFTKLTIEKRNLPFKKFLWRDFTNVILKDNLLTLDFKNNRLLQAEIETVNIDEDAFNTFAKAQLINQD